MEQPLQLEAQAAFPELQPELPRGHRLQRVRLVEDHEVVGKEEPRVLLPVILRPREQGEIEGVVDHHQIGGTDFPPSLLEKTTARAAAFRGA